MEDTIRNDLKFVTIEGNLCTVSTARKSLDLEFEKITGSLHTQHLELIIDLLHYVRMEL